MKTRPVHLPFHLLYLFILSFLAACGSGEPQVPPTPTLSPLQVEIEEAIAQFEAQDINSYTMQVTYRKAGWDPQVLEVEVVDNQATILDQSCFPDRTCFERPVEGADFTLPAIFTVVREQAAFLEGIIEVTYNAEYGFPRMIATAEKGAFEISNFQPTE